MIKIDVSVTINVSTTTMMATPPTMMMMMVMMMMMMMTAMTTITTTSTITTDATVVVDAAIVIVKILISVLLLTSGHSSSHRQASCMNFGDALPLFIVANSYSVEETRRKVQEEMITTWLQNMTGIHISGKEKILNYQLHSFTTIHMFVASACRSYMYETIPSRV